VRYEPSLTLINSQSGLTNKTKQKRKQKCTIEHAHTPRAGDEYGSGSSLLQMSAPQLRIEPQPTDTSRPRGWLTTTAYIRGYSEELSLFSAGRTDRKHGRPHTIGYSRLTTGVPFLLTQRSPILHHTQRHCLAMCVHYNAWSGWFVSCEPPLTLVNI